MTKIGGCIDQNIGDGLTGHLFYYDQQILYKRILTEFIDVNSQLFSKCPKSQRHRIFQCHLHKQISVDFSHLLISRLGEDLLYKNQVYIQIHVYPVQYML